MKHSLNQNYNLLSSPIRRPEESKYRTKQKKQDKTKMTKAEYQEQLLKEAIIRFLQYENTAVHVDDLAEIYEEKRNKILKLLVPVIGDKVTFTKFWGETWFRAMPSNNFAEVINKNDNTR